MDDQTELELSAIELNEYEQEAAAKLAEMEAKREKCEHEERTFFHEIPHEGIPASITCEECKMMITGEEARRNVRTNDAIAAYQ